jgi:hypothetical protein
MAQISSISNGEGMSTVRTKLNNVITEINLLDPTDWVDYSATSTIVGWSSFTTKRIRYRVIGKQIFVSYNLLGTSNSTSANFSLPFPILNNTELATPLVVNNGGYALVIADLSGGCFISSNTFGVRWAGSSTGWTASGTKQISGQFFYEIA